MNYIKTMKPCATGKERSFKTNKCINKCISGKSRHPETQRCRKVENLEKIYKKARKEAIDCLLYTSPSPRDRTRSRMPSSA